MTLLFAYLLTLLAGYALAALNLCHLRRHGTEVPQPFAGVIDADHLRKSSAYTWESSRLGLLQSAWDNLVLLLFLFGGGLSVYDRWVASLSDSFVLQGVLFFLLLYLAKGLLEIPFSLYRTFVIEQRYGFNTTGWRLWLSDLVKGTLLGGVLLGLLLSGAFWLVQADPQHWWLWVWALFAGFSLLLIYLSPVLIEPLFFKFEPLRREGLEAAVKGLLAGAGLRVSRVFQIDASRRSRHSNAYFSGIGRVKRIVLFDTLLTQLEDEELLAVLAHEAGHWTLRHIGKRLLSSLLLSLAGCWLAWKLLTWGGLPGLVGTAAASFPAQVLILTLPAAILGFFAGPLACWRSRRHERQADAFACRLHGRPRALASALVKLSRDNLANLHPHPWYAAFHFTHPPVVERVARLLREGDAGTE